MPSILKQEILSPGNFYQFIDQSAHTHYQHYNAKGIGNTAGRIFAHFHDTTENEINGDQYGGNANAS